MYRPTICEEIRCMEHIYMARLRISTYGYPMQMSTEVKRDKYMKETRKTGCMDIYMARLRFSTYVHPIQM